MARLTDTLPVTDNQGYDPLIAVTISSFPTGFVTRVTRRVLQVEHDLLILPEYEFPPQFPGRTRLAAASDKDYQ